MYRIMPMVGAANFSKRPKLSKKLLRTFKREQSLIGRLARSFLVQDKLMAIVVNGGAANPAKVVSIAPTLIVAALSTDFDDVVFLEFDPTLVTQHGLQIGDSLVTASIFTPKFQHVKLVVDLMEGISSTKNFYNFHPVVLELVSEEKQIIDVTKHALPRWEWERLDELVEEMIPFRMAYPRNGNPYISGVPNPRAAEGISQLRAKRTNLPEASRELSGLTLRDENAKTRSRRRRR